MTNRTLIHCAEPRLGGPPGNPARAADRLSSFTAVVERAHETRAEAILVAGRLLDPSRPTPAGLSGVERCLARARELGIPVVCTAEREDAAWLDWLAERGLIELLAYPRPGRSALPVLTTASGARVAGLGRPPDALELERRAARLAPSRRGTAGSRPVSVVLVHAPTDVGPAVLDQLAAATTYLALGGGSPCESHEGRARDPGPLTRMSPVTAPTEPVFLEIAFDDPGIRVDTRKAPDRPVVTVELEVGPDTPASRLETDLRRHLRRAPGEPLLIIQLNGEAATHRQSELAERAERLARELLKPVELVVLNRLHDPEANGPGQPPRSRQELESFELDRLLASRPEPIATLARELLPLLSGERTGIEEAREALERALSPALPKAAKRRRP